MHFLSHLCHSAMQIYKSAPMLNRVRWGGVLTKLE